MIMSSKCINVLVFTGKGQRTQHTLVGELPSFVKTLEVLTFQKKNREEFSVSGNFKRENPLSQPDTFLFIAVSFRVLNVKKSQKHGCSRTF